MKKANTYRFNIQFRAVTGDQIQVGEFLSGLGRLKSTCIIEAVKQYMIAHPEIAAAALVKVGSPASSGVSPLNAAPPSPPKAVEDSNSGFHSVAPASSEDESLDIMIKNLELFK